MNQYGTVKPLYPGAFPPPTPEEDDAPYPKAPLNLTLGFDLETWQIPLEELLPSKKVPVACCRFRGHEDKIVTKELESGYDETEVQP